MSSRITAGWTSRLKYMTNTHTVIEPSSAYKPVNFREIWDFRDLVLSLANRDVTLRYRQTVLGVVWVLLQPLLQSAIMAVVFSRIAHLKTDGLPAFAYIFVGMSVFNLFSSIVTKASTSLLSNAALVSKVFFPRLILPFAAAFSSLIDFAVSIVAAILIMAVYHIIPAWTIIFLPVCILFVILLAEGISCFAAAWMVVYRDIQFVIPVMLPLLMYASPVAYAMEAIPKRWQLLFAANPITGLLEAFRWCIFGRGYLNVGQVVYAMAVSILFFAVGTINFKRVEKRFADVI